MTQTYHLLCLSEAASPITHMSRSEGNESVVAREPVVTASGIRFVPCLSGNALRHRAIREPGARHLVDSWGLAGKLTLDQLNFLFHGGALTRGSGRENTRIIADFQRLFPLGRLLGGCLPEQILAGSMLVGRGVLVCEENRATLASLWGESVGDMPALRPAESFVSGYQYTRGDARESHAGMAAESTNGADMDSSNLMIFAGQQVTRGALFLHDFLLQNVSTVELGALAWSLRLWQGNGGTIGGQAARGHGRLKTMVLAGDDLALGDAADLYLAHAERSRDEGVAWLATAFAAPEAKPARASKKAVPA